MDIPDADMSPIAVAVGSDGTTEGDTYMGTLTRLITQYLAERKASGSYGSRSVRAVRLRLYSLDKSFGDRPMRDLTDTAVLRWLGQLDHLAPSSRAAYLGSVRAFGDWLVRRKLVRVNPCEGIDRPRVPPSTPRAQSADVMAAVLAACHDPRDRAIVHLMVGCGLRCMEVAGLRWEHYDDRGRTLLVAEAKNGKDRVLPVPDAVAGALDSLGVRAAGPVIRSALDGRSPLQPRSVGARVAKVMRRAGVKHAPWDGVSAHALRHTAASDVLDRCGDLRVVQEMLGHADLKTTAIYLRRASVHQMREAMEGRDYDSEPPPRDNVTHLRAA